MCGLPTVRLRTGSGNCTMADLPTGTVTSLCSRMAPVQLGPLAADSRLASAVAGLPIVTWIGPPADTRTGLVGAAALLFRMADSTPTCACAEPSHNSPTTATASAAAFMYGPMQRVCLLRCLTSRSMTIPQIGCSA